MAGQDNGDNDNDGNGTAMTVTAIGNGDGKCLGPEKEGDKWKGWSLVFGEGREEETMMMIIIIYYSVDAVVCCAKIMKYYDAVLCAFEDGGDEGGRWQSDDY